MENTTNRKVLFVLATLALFALGAIAFGTKVKAYPSSIFTQASAGAVTTQSYMTQGTATTTYQFDSPTFTPGVSGKVANMQGIDATSLYVLFNASSTGSYLEWQISYSNDNVNWYGESATVTTAGRDIASSTSGTVLQEASSTVTHLWAPGVTGTSTKTVLLPATPALHERVQFFIPIGSTNGAVYNEADLKQNPSTP